MSKEPADRIEGLQEALALLSGLGQSVGPTSWIAGLEVRLRGSDGPQVRTVIESEGFGRETLDVALLIKRVSGLRTYPVGGPDDTGATTRQRASLATKPSIERTIAAARSPAPHRALRPPRMIGRAPGVRGCDIRLSTLLGREWIVQPWSTNAS
jgi:hypothetical protein